MTANAKKKSARKKSTAKKKLDLDDLKTRLRESPALSFFDKLQLKDDLEELLEEARDLHAVRPNPGSRAEKEMHSRFDGIVDDVLEMLESDDRDLARDIRKSRRALYKLLSDPVQFASLKH